MFMQTFFDWIQLRESINPSDEGEGAALTRMAEIAWKAHNHETRAFFQKLSKIDPEIAEEFKRLGEDSFDLPKTDRRDDRDEVRLSAADSSPGMSGDDD